MARVFNPAIVRLRRPGMLGALAVFYRVIPILFRAAILACHRLVRVIPVSLVVLPMVQASRIAPALFRRPGMLGALVQ